MRKKECWQAVLDRDFRGEDLWWTESLPPQILDDKEMVQGLLKKFSSERLKYLPPKFQDDRDSCRVLKMSCRTNWGLKKRDRPKESYGAGPKVARKINNTR